MRPKSCNFQDNLLRGTLFLVWQMRKREANNTMDDIRQFKQIQTYYVLPKIFLFSQFHATGFPLKNSLLPPVFPRTSPPQSHSYFVKYLV